ncbi:MAG: VWA domain-containing protein [Terriglobales bacterium]
MNKVMKGVGLIVLAIWIPLAGGQNSPEADLPSAPSATKMQQQAPTPPPPAAPKEETASQPKSETPPASPSAGGRTEKTEAPVAAPAASTASPPSAASVPRPSETDQDSAITTFTKRVDEVNVVFTVTDKRGRFVKDLTRKDFAVLDDKKPVLSVVNFRAETDLPLRVGLLVDASASIRDRFRFEQEAAVEFMNQTVRYRKDLAFVLGFDSEREVTQDFTDVSELLSKGIRMLRPGGGTAMYDAVYFSCRDKLMNLEETIAVRRAIILFSDGEDNQSRTTREESIEMCQRAEVVIYAISTNVTGRTPWDRVLERIAEATGGRFFAPFKLDDVANALQEIQEELRSQYAVAYRPAEFVADGRFRERQFRSLGKKYNVRSRKGYYAPRK